MPSRLVAQGTRVAAHTPHILCWVPSVRGLSVDESYFFFQAEDGIRDYKVTGVQTCALPILSAARHDGGDAIRLVKRLTSGDFACFARPADFASGSSFRIDFNGHAIMLGRHRTDRKSVV